MIYCYEYTITNAQSAGLRCFVAAERIAAANAGQQSVERAPGSQQEPTFDGFDSPEQLNLVCKVPGFNPLYINCQPSDFNQGSIIGETRGD